MQRGVRTTPAAQAPDTPPNVTPTTLPYARQRTDVLLQIPHMTNARLLTWLRQRLPQLEAGQLPDPTIDLDDTRRTAADRPDQLRAADRPVRILQLTPPLNSPVNVRIASAEELANVLPGIDPNGHDVYLIAP